MTGMIKSIAEICAAGLELMGILVISAAAVYALASFVPGLPGAGERPVVERARHRLGHGVLLGLELLVGADIIYTVAIEFTYENVGVLAIIVGIRTVLSFTLEVEMNGRWPWQQPEQSG